MLKRFLAFAMTVAVLVGAGALASCNGDLTAPKPVVAEKLGTAHETMLVNCIGEWWSNGEEFICNGQTEWCYESSYAMGECEFELEYFIMSACDAFGGEWCDGGGGCCGEPPPPGPPHVTIVCTPLGSGGSHIQRGRSVDCRVSDPQDSLAAWNPTYVWWRFAPDSLTMGIDTVTASNHTGSWIGIAAMGGKVKLRLRLQQGAQDTTVEATTSFTVTARGLDSVPVRTANDLESPPPYDTVNAFPNPDHKDSLGRATFPPSGNTFYIPVTTGPNKGYVFFHSYLLTHVPLVKYPWSEFQPGGHYWTLAPGSVSGNWCTKAFVQNTLAGLVRVHEGVNREAESHTRAVYDYLAANATAIRNRTEALVFDSVKTTYNQRYEYIVNFTAFEDAAEVPDDDPNYGFYGPNSCAVKYQ